MILRRKTRTVMVGSVAIGGDAPVTVQSMTKTNTCDIAATVKQANNLAEAGCELVRIAVPTLAAARAIAEIQPAVNVPVIADVHFRPEIAIAALESGADKIRLNPGNTRNRAKVRAVLDAAKDLGRAVRLGVNSGSLPRGAAGGPRQGTASRMVALLMEWCEFCDSCGFTELVLSAKSSDAVATMDAYRELSGRVDYPLHLGITAAGLPAEGRLKSGIVIGGLLAEGIGDTIRVSLTGDPVEEVSAAKEILATLGLRQREGIEIISCPTCGRCEVDLASIVRAVKRETRDIKAPMQVAVMGCVVNGPGEAREADVGVAAGDKDSWMLFCRGRRVRKVPQDRLLKELLAEVRRLANLPS